MKTLTPRQVHTGNCFEATLEVESIREEVQEFGSGEARLTAAIANLNSYINRLLPLIANLKSAAGGD